MTDSEALAKLLDGATFGRLKLADTNIEPRPCKSAKARFVCVCGKSKEVRISHVIQGNTVSCGCVKRTLFVAEGQRVGRLVVLSLDERRVKKSIKVMCRCDCGTEKWIVIADLAYGVVNSCGCLVKEQVSALSRKHGGEGTPLYTVWRSMLNRCADPKNASFHRYGGRGIRVCDEWLTDFAAFRAWSMANQYARGLQIDRIDNDGYYEPANCRWVTARENGNNRRQQRLALRIRRDEDHEELVERRALRG